MDPGTLLKEGLEMLVGTGGPMIGALVLSGLGVGVLQAATQVNDPAVGFVPRLLVLMASVWLLGPWMVERLSLFLAASMQAMTLVGH